MTNPEPVTRDQVLEALREVVAEAGPDHAAPIVDGSCRYEVNEEPSCIAGRAAVKLGIANLDILKAWDHGTVAGQSLGISVALGRTAAWQGKAEGVPGPLRPVADDAISVLAQAQIMQDEVPDPDDLYHDGLLDPDDTHFGTSWGYVLSEIEDGE